MSYRLDIEVPFLPKMPNQLLYRHWRTTQAEKNRVREQIWAALAGRKPSAPLDRARVKFTRFSPAPPDPDNLVGSFKYVLDALVHEGVLVNDRYENVELPRPEWFKVQRKDMRIRIEVQELNA